jgi:enamine deaminase RidA (YjgF/YER057c/UK114 family)
MVECSGLAAPLGLYSHVSRVKSGDPIYIAGQVGVDSQGRLVGADDFATQMRQVFDNIGAALKSAGGSFADVAKFTTFVTRDTDIAAFMETRKEIFAKLYPSGGYPPNTLLVISRLVKPEFLIEIEAIAVV